MNKTQAQRLLNVARALRESKTPEHFTMKFFVHGDYDRWDTEHSSDPNMCGTPACALGHYGSRPDLQKLMKIEIQSDGAGLVYRRGYTDEFGDETVGHLDATVLDHFGIDEDEGEDLFGQDGCNGTKNVEAAAKYIEKFVREKTSTALDETERTQLMNLVPFLVSLKSVPKFRNLTAKIQKSNGKFTAALRHALETLLEDFPRTFTARALKKHADKLLVMAADGPAQSAGRALASSIELLDLK